MPGGLTEEQLRGPAWRRLFRGVSASAELPVTHALRARAAGSFVAPGAVVTGASAGALRGIDLVGPEDDVEPTVPPGAHPRRVPGLRVRRAQIAARGCACCASAAGVAEVDVACPAHRVAVEHDGPWHSEPSSSAGTAGG